MSSITPTSPEISKEERAAKDAMDGVRNGRIIIFVMIGIMALACAIQYYQFDESIEIIYIYAPFISIYALLGIFYYRNPFVISIIALSIFLVLQAFNVYYDPSSITRGIILKIIIVGFLVRAIMYGRNYNTARKKSASEILDEDFK